MKNWLLVFATAFSLSASAATWYVDNTAVGSNNGTSWANAWTSLASASAVSAGDTVYISGGSTGNTQTYNTSGASATPKAGTSGSPVTYKIGQDSAHNGTAIFSANPLVDKSYVVFSGDAGDGNKHFQYSGGGYVLYNGGSFNGVRISYVDCGSRQYGFYVNGGTGIEIDHISINKTDGGADYVAYLQVSGSGWDVNSVHDSTISIIRSSSGNGDDGIQGSPNSLSVYNNTFSGVQGTYSGGQHQDAIQYLAGSYLKIYNNRFTDIANYPIFGDSYFGDFSHFWVYNNIVVLASSGLQSTPAPQGIAIGPDGGVYSNLGRWPVFTDVIVCNNTIDGYVGHAAISLYNPGSTSATWTDCVIKNNIMVNAGANINGAISAANNVNLSMANSTNYFTSYGANRTNNNYALAPAASTLIDLGTDLSSYFTTDYIGATRSAPWDIGAYEYGGAVGNHYPVAIASADSTTGLAPFTVAFTGDSSYDVDGTALTNYWNFGGLGYSTLSNPTFTFTNVGTYNVTLTVGDGTNTTTSSTLQIISYTNSVIQNLEGTTFYAATDSTLTSPFVASGTSYVYQASQITDYTSAGRALFVFNVSSGGTFYIEAIVDAPNDSQNSFFFSTNSAVPDVWDVTNYTSGAESRIVSKRGTGDSEFPELSPYNLTFAAGTNTLSFYGREANVKLYSWTATRVTVDPGDGVEPTGRRMRIRRIQ